MEIMFELYDDILTLEGFMEMLSIGRNKAYELLGSGEIKALKFGKIWRIPKASVESYIIDKCMKSV